MRRFVAGSTIFLLTGFAFAGEYVIREGDTLSKIADQNGTSYQVICKLNRLPDCNKIGVGQKLKVPPQGKENPQDRSKEITPPKRTGVVDAPRKFRNLGADPLCTSREVKNGTCREKQERRLIASGWTKEDAKTHLDDVDAGRCFPSELANGFVGDWLVNGSSTWGKTVFALRGKKKTEALSCPEVNGRKPYVVTQCHNSTGKYVPIAALVVAPPPSSVEKKVVERRGGCNLEETLWGQVGFGNGIRNRSGSGELSCQFPLDEKWTAGPVFRAGVGQFGSESWIEKTGLVGGGIRTRGKGVFGLDEFKLDFPVVGYGWARGHTTDGMVDKPTIGGLDAYFAETLKKGVELEEGSILVTEFMSFGQFPITNKSGPIFWQGQKVDSDSRHNVFGALLRFGLERDEWDVVPEFTLGGWHTSGIERPWGGKVLVGIATKDRSFRAGIGVEGPHAHGIVEAEVNFYGPWILESARKSEVALTDGATSSCEALGMKNCPKLEKLEKEKPVVMAKTTQAPKERERDFVSEPKARIVEVPMATATSVVQRPWCGNKGSCVAVETAPVSERPTPVVHQEVQPVQRPGFSQGEKSLAEENFWEVNRNG